MIFNIHQKPKFQSRPGFTLIEMLIYIFCLVLIIGAIVIFGWVAIRSGLKIKANAEVLDNARRAVEIMTLEIKKSRSIYTPTSIFDNNPGQLSLEQTASSTSETLTFVDFFKCGDSLCIRREDSSPLVLTSTRVKVSNLIFTQLSNLNSPSVQITLRVESAASSVLPDYASFLEVTTSVSLRDF